jgi:trans-aconitate 2-methyltransferase
MDNKKTIEFYDDYIKEQLTSGINDRIQYLYKKLLQLGLRKNSNVLELGSGIGTLTYLLSKVVKTGNVEAVDISGGSIKFAQNRIKQKNITFFANDIVNYLPVIKDIDFITLFDIIEHIPIELHPALFENLSNLCDEKTLLLINIPNPDYINYDIKNNPSVLQIIDQPIPLPLLIQNLRNTDLIIKHFETNSIWVEEDYQFLILQKHNEFAEIKLSTKRNYVKKILKKINNIYFTLKHNYK